MIVPLTRAYYDAIYPEHPVHRIRGKVLLDETGQPIAIGGYYLSSGHRVAFARITPDAGTRVRDLIKLSRAVLPMFDGQEVYAIQDVAMPTSARVLAHFGFEPVEDNVWRR